MQAGAQCSGAELVAKKFVHPCLLRPKIVRFGNEEVKKRESSSPFISI